MTTKIIVPERYGEILANSKNYVGLMGLSVGKADFENPQTMTEYARFMQERFAYSLMVVADVPKRHNIMALEGVSEVKAEQRARVAGDDMRNAIEKITRDYPNVKVARWRHFAEEKYSHNLEVLQEAYRSDGEFMDECNCVVWKFLSQSMGNPRTNPNISVADRVANAKNYLLEELALLVAIPFAFQLPVCEIYPGRNEIHERIQNREFEFCGDLNIRDDKVFMEAYYKDGD